AGLVVTLATVAVVVVGPPVAEAATDTVTNCSGSASVTGSLPYEVAHAGSGDTIVFALSPPCATITLASAIVLSQNLTITGPGADTLAVSGGSSVTVFAVDSGITDSISGLTIEDAYNNTGFGGGIYNDGTLHVTDVTLSDNTNAVGYGGGIYNDSSGNLTVTASTLSDNTALSGYGGGILNDGTLVVTNSTLTGNASTGVGGGIDNQATATVTDSTLSDNSAQFGGNLNNLGTLNIGTSIVADSVTGTDCHGPGTLTDLGYNLDDDGSCGFSGTGDLSHTAAGLDPSGLQNNGGPTETIALESGSAAIDHVSNAILCPATDQRGAPRSHPCDVGAYDTDWGPAVTLDVSGTQTSGEDANLTYTTNAPPGIVSGTLSCATVDGGTPIAPGLAAGYYTVDGSSCSGLSSSAQQTHAIFPSSYAGVPSGFVVSAPPTWSIVPSPSPASNENQLYSVSCTSDTSCVAVGFAYDGTRDTTLVESWNGSVWTQVSSPNPSSGDNILTAVSCTSATDCQAVGNQLVGTTLENLAESWNGSAWSVTTIPDQGSLDNGLLSISCLSATDCQAVGGYGNPSTYQTLAESFNGSTWSIVASPDQGTGANQLNGVSCTSATDCQAVGNDINGSTNQTLAESWNGTTWSLTSSPNRGSGDNFLYSLSCVGATHCQAVGYDVNGSADDTLVESFNDGTWSITSSPNQGTSPFLSSVSCANATSCVAVGSAMHGAKNQTLIESWNGTAWSITSSADEGSGDNVLYGVSCSSSTSCAAGGYAVNGATQDTLVEMAPFPVVAAVSPTTDVTTGGTTVTITGSGFTGATAVDFGSTPAVIDTESGDTSLTVTAPPGSAGPPVDITVTAPGGVSTVNTADEFTYTAPPAPTTVACQPSCTNTVSTTLNQTSVSVAGNSGTSSSGPSTTLEVDTAALSCGSSRTHDYDYSTAVSTLSATDFPSNAVLTVTETVGNEPSTSGVKVCYAPGSNTTGTFLHVCRPSMTAPCLQSLTESSGSVIATFLSPANDPRFWTGLAAADLKSFAPAKADPGAMIAIKGKNLTGVQAVVIGGLNATISDLSTATKLLVTVPLQAVAGPGIITVTAASGEAASTKKFTVK
ncbi:MAG TPA: right-handed parallel beta-helix repeat-containing protein, partial [Acidimicrobiales bacterium]|nr:right-handed parallel beta-helix repeat-containing protein [Acidimicrobiales bacterium]